MLRVLSAGTRRFAAQALPRKWRLPLKYWRHLRKGCESELKHLESICPCGGTAVDAGANSGFYTYRMAELFSNVYAFEPIKKVTRDLAAWKPKHVTLINAGLSSKRRRAELFIPVVRGRALFGWAGLAPGNHPAAETHLREQVELYALDQFRLDNVALVKIDVEGHELEVLRGARQTLARWRPVVLIELAERNAADVRKLFRALHYQERTLHDLAGERGSQQNVIFVPGALP